MQLIKSILKPDGPDIHTPLTNIILVTRTRQRKNDPYFGLTRFRDGTTRLQTVSSHRAAELKHNSNNVTRMCAGESNTPRRSVQEYT